MQRDDEEEDYEALAGRIVHARFTISILKHQEERQHECSNQITKTLEKARSASAANSAPTKPGGFLGEVFGVEADDPLDKPATAGLSKRDVDKLKQQKGRLDQLAGDISRKIFQLEESAEGARKEVRRLLREPVFSISEARHAMKIAVLALAEKVDPPATECAQTLGKLWLRTPAFFVSSGLLGRQGTAESKAQKYEELPRGTLDHTAMDSWAIYEEIDGLVESAAMHDEVAIEQLLALLVDDKLQHALRHHIIRMVADKAAYVFRQDQDRSSESGFRSAMVANWPKAHTSAPNHKVYSSIVSLVHNQANEYVEDEKELAVGTRASMSSGLSRKGSGRSRVSTGALQKPHPIDRQLKLVDANFVDVLGKDSLLHITPQVVEALLKIGEVGFERFHREELVLYGSDIPEIKWQEPHWFLRRKAALRVCELSAEGNVLASELIHQRLLRDTEHWVIRSLVIEEMCRMLGHMTPEQPIFREFLDELSRVLFTFPVVAKVPTRAFREQELSNQGLSNAQRAAEATLTKELVNYPYEVRSYIMQDLMRRTQSREGDQKRQVVDRILRAIGGMPTKGLGGNG